MLYNEQDLDAKIHSFLERKETRFPELDRIQSIHRLWEEKYKPAGRPSNLLQPGW